MPSGRIEKIRTVRRYSGAGIAACSDALVATGGDVYLAIRQLMSHQQIADAWRSLILRREDVVGAKHAATKEEIGIVKRLFDDVVRPTLPAGLQSPYPPRPRPSVDPISEGLAEQSDEYDRVVTGKGVQFFTWFAVDTNGCIGWFSARHAAAVPTAVFDCAKSEHMVMYEFFLRLLEGKVYRQLGLYEYDNDCGQIDGYERINVPESPRTPFDCPTDVGACALAVRYPGRFCRTGYLLARRTWECIAVDA